VCPLRDSSPRFCSACMWTTYPHLPAKSS
jgi:hypothetical protein